ncbi:unnamed protein product [Prunus brigantina]
MILNYWEITRNENKKMSQLNVSFRLSFHRNFFSGNKQTEREREHIRQAILIMEKLGQIDGKRQRSAQRNLAAVPPCLGLRDPMLLQFSKRRRHKASNQRRCSLSQDDAASKPTSGLGFHNLSYLGLGSRGSYPV